MSTLVYCDASFGPGVVPAWACIVVVGGARTTTASGPLDAPRTSGHAELQALRHTMLFVEGLEPGIVECVAFCTDCRSVSKAFDPRWPLLSRDMRRAEVQPSAKSCSAVPGGR